MISVVSSGDGVDGVDGDVGVVLCCGLSLSLALILILLIDFITGDGR